MTDRSDGQMEIVLDARCMMQKKEAHEYLRRNLELPDYYGENMDALYDCLTEYDGLKIVVANYESTDAYVSGIIQIMRDADVEVQLL